MIAVARCFTGWTVRNPEDPEFVFAPFMHDFGEKTVLGHKIPAGGGEQDGLEVIDILAHHPSTAKFISLELARHFVADDPPQALVDRMAQTFTKTDGDLRAVMETMFRRPSFSPKAHGRPGSNRLSKWSRARSALWAATWQTPGRWCRRSPIWASRFTANWSRPVIRIPPRRG